MSSATWLLFTGVPARCVVLHVRSARPLGSCSPVCSIRAVCCVRAVLGLLTPGNWCACSVRCVAFVVSWATWLLFTGVLAPCGVLLVRCPGPLGSRSPVCPLGALCWVCGVLGHLALVHLWARLVRCVACAVSWATWLPFTDLLAQCVVLSVRCPGPLASPAPVCPLGVLCCVCCVLGHLAPVHRCAHLVRCVVCAVSWATWLLFTGVPARCVLLRVRCPWPLGSCSPVCSLRAVCCVPGVLGLLAPGHWCACLVRCVAFAVSWATWLLFIGAHARRAVLRVRCPGPLGSCSQVCTPALLCCVCGVPGHLAPVHRCARSACCVACAVSWATYLLFTGAHARCDVLCVRCPGPFSSCSPVCPLGALSCVCGVPALLAPVHRDCWPHAVCCVCGVLGLLAPVQGEPAQQVLLRVWCPGPLGPCSKVRTLRVLCCVWSVLGHLAPVHRRARLLCCVVCAMYWATWLLFTGVHARRLVLHVPCPGPVGSCSPISSLGVLCCVCGVLGHLAPVHRCARSACCVACAVSWPTWPLFTGAQARCAVLHVRCPGPLGSCSPLCTLSVVCCVCGVL